MHQYKPFKTRKPPRDSERFIKQELTALVSQITRRETPYCVLCLDNNWNRLECGHFWHRDMPPTEFDLDNLNTLCHDCNQAHESNPEPYRAYMREKLGEQGYDDLTFRAHSQTKVGYIQLFELREQMKARLAELNGRVA